MFGEEEEEVTAADTLAADIDAEHERQKALHTEDNDATAAADSTAATEKPEDELTPMAKLLQAESKLSLYQQRLEQVGENPNVVASKQ